MEEGTKRVARMQLGEEDERLEGHGPLGPALDEVPQDDLPVGGARQDLAPVATPAAFSRFQFPDFNFLPAISIFVFGSDLSEVIGWTWPHMTRARANVSKSQTSNRPSWQPPASS